MTRVLPRNFAPFLATALVVWPVMAYTGAQGFTGSVGIAGLIALLYLRIDGVKPYIIAGLGFLLWTVAASTWGPSGGALFEGSLLKGDFSVEAIGVRFGLTLLAAMAMIMAVKAVGEAQAARSLVAIEGAAWVNGVAALITAIFLAPLMAWILDQGLSTDYGSLTQNLLRNANCFALLLPILLARLWYRDGGLGGRAVAGLVVVLSVLTFALTGTQTALMGLAFAGLAMAIVHVLSRSGFRVLFWGLSAVTLLGPVLYGAVGAVLLRSGLPLPGSFFSRIKGWQLVNEKITEAPLFGHGVEATYQWGTLFAERPEWLAEALDRYGLNQGWQKYEILNSHPHSMPLQVWVDTGFIGAGFLSLTLFLFGLRLKRPDQWPPMAKYAAAGLIGVASAVYGFSLSLWNEAFWCSVALAAAAVLLMARQAGQEQTK
ncbi:MAG: O-antigen ligase family protein [Pseudomonadota bacterium]